MTTSTSSLPGQRDDAPAIVVQPERRQGLGAFVARRRALLALSGLCATLGTLLGLVPLYAIYRIALLTFGAEPGAVSAGAVLWLALACVGAALARGVLLMGATSLSHAAAYDILYDMRIALARQLARLPLGFFSDTTTGRIKKVIHEDVEQMEEGIAHLIPDTVSGIVTPLATISFLLLVDWRMALAMLGSLVLAIGIYALMMGWASGMYATYNLLVAQMNAAVIQYINGMKVIKAFTQTDASFTKLQATITEMEEFYRDMQARIQPIFAGMLVLVRASLIVLLPVGIWLLLGGSLDVPTFVLFLVASMGFNRPIFQLFLGLGYAMYQVQAASTRIAALLNAAPLPEPARPQPPQGAAIAFQGVSFAYGDTPVLSNVSFSVPEGSVTALVGPSGAGKTTIARLIPRFWDVSTGSITVGGVDVRQIGTERLMEQVAFVFQDVFLFNDSVRENIRVGKPGASDAEVEAAARAARCHAFIVGELPQGYDTVVGENGGRLSGGQRQRLSIARAILKDAPIVVLDEATAFVDPENEGLIQEALSALLQAGKTLIIVAHRLSTITGVDQILVVDEGRIVARGTHDELLRHSPLYAQLWQAHVGAQGYAFSNVERNAQSAKRSEPESIEPVLRSALERFNAFDNPYAELDERDGLLTMIRKLSVGTGTLLRDGLLAKVAEGAFVALPSLLLVFILIELLSGAPRAGVLWALTAGVLAGYIGQYLCARVGMRNLMRLDITIHRNLRLFLADYMRRLPLGFFTRRDVGAIDALFTTHIQFLETRLVIDLTIIAIVTPALVFLNMLAWDWRLALAAAAGMPFALLALRAAMGTFARVWRTQSDARTSANSRMVEYIQGIPVIRAFNLGGTRLGQFQQALDTYRLASRRTTTAFAPAFAIFITVVELGFAAVVVLGAALFAAGSLAAPTFLLLLVLASAFYAPLIIMGDAIAVQRIMQNAVRNVNEFLRSPLLPEPVRPQQPQGFAISFEKVRFDYGEGQPVLRGVSFQIPERSITALVGPSGSGKTTITSLIARFWDVTGGTVRVGGVDVRDQTADALLAQLTMVFQDVYLFNDTIANNIRIGRPQASDEEVERAARMAQIHEFIAGLPEGYQTVVGEGGSTLSGGQKQRISIARAILKDAPIVLLDEATASIDPENEQLIQQAFNALAAEKTLVIIAHRLTTIQQADQILVLEAGQIVERGTHAALMAGDGLYRRFWREREQARGWKLGAVPPSR